MKTKFTKFKCDTCGKEITVEGDKGYPYQEGWAYLFNLEMQIPEINHNFVRKGLKDNHFCSRECLINKIESLRR